MRCTRLGRGGHGRCGCSEDVLEETVAPLVSSATRPESKDPQACFSNHKAPTPLPEDRNCASVILFIRGGERFEVRGEDVQQAIFMLTQHATAHILCAFVQAAG